MKYLAVFDDNFLSNFRLDDNGLTLVLTDKTNCTRATKLLPIQRPVLTVENGGSVFLTQDHIQALLKFERDKMFDEMIKDINKSFEEIPKSYIPKEELRRMFGLQEEST